MTDSKKSGIDELLRFAIETVRLAGAEALAQYGQGRAHIRFDVDLVTEAELRISKLFKGRLESHFPEHQLFGNNQPDRNYTHKGERHLWIYDALDGVANFQAGIPVWGVSLALLENYWPIMGVFYMPATDDIFYALAGKRAYKEDQRIQCTSQAIINDEALLLTYSRFHQHYSSSFPGKIRNLGCTAAHVCYVACGRAEAAILANATYQDLAAVRVILEAAGGKIFHTDGAEFFLNEYLDGKRINDPLIVGSPEIHPSIYRYLKVRGKE